MMNRILTSSRIEACPACGQPWQPTGAITIAPDPGDVMLRALPSELNRGLVYDRCQHCATVVAVDERRHEGVLATAYDELPSAYWTELAENRRFSARVERAIRAHVSGGELWDIGCGGGTLLGHLDGRWRKHGIEPGSRAVESARARGFDVRSGTATQLGLIGVADVVTAIDVVEHLLDPRAELAAIHQMLRPGGIAVIFTGAADGLVPRLAGRQWYYLQCVGHVTVFSRNGLRRLLSAVGFEILETRSVEHGGAVRLNRWARRYAANFARRILGRPPAALHYFRDHQLLIAKRSE